MRQMVIEKLLSLFSDLLNFVHFYLKFIVLFCENRTFESEKSENLTILR
jgi:hypothetical protein